VRFCFFGDFAHWKTIIEKKNIEYLNILHPLFSKKSLSLEIKGLNIEKLFKKSKAQLPTH